MFDCDTDTKLPSCGLSVVGVSHRTADLSLRGILALDSAKSKEFTRRLEGAGAEECLVLSTCNRTEVYSVGIAPQFVIAELASFSGLSLEKLLEVVYTRTQVW